MNEAGEKKKIFIIAGPNGAGKTTFANAFLPFEADCPNFLNADLIAAGFSPFDVEKVALLAARLMLRQLFTFVEAGESFCFETTLSGTAYARMIPNWQERGYKVSLFFLALSGPESAVERVAKRVREGGAQYPSSSHPSKILGRNGKFC